MTETLAEHMASREASRKAHLAWCKGRAMEYADAGDDTRALSSMLADIGKWDGGEMYAPDILRYHAVEGMHFASHGRVREWIEALK